MHKNKIEYFIKNLNLSSLNCCLMNQTIRNFKELNRLTNYLRVSISDSFLLKKGGRL